MASSDSPRTIWDHPKAVEVDYANRLKTRTETAAKLAKRAFGRIRSVYGPRINRNAERREDSIEQVIEAIRRAIRSAGRSFFRTHNRSIDRRTIRTAANRADNHNRRLMMQKVGRVSEVRAIPKSIPDRQIRKWADENVDEIRSLHEELFDDIAESLIAGIKAGEHVGSIGERINGITGRFKRRDELLARDQMGTLNAQINEHRQTRLGIEKYRWTDSGDDKVRDLHEVLHGQVFAWNDPPAEGHPGEPINCRCIPDPQIEAFLRNDAFFQHFDIVDETSRFHVPDADFETAS